MNINQFERRTYSQNGEDGIIEFLISSIYKDPHNKQYLEIGTESGVECNTRILREHYGWTGVLIDSTYENLEIGLHKYRVDMENILQILSDLKVPNKVNLISVDIDSIDFYVLWQILTKYESDIIICEYNVDRGPIADEVIEYDSNFNWEGTNYYGASLVAYTNLCNHYNYQLIGTESRGVNAFFLSNQVIKDSGLNIDNINDPFKLYSIGKWGPGLYGGQGSETGKLFVSSKHLLNS